MCRDLVPGICSSPEELRINFKVMQFTTSEKFLDTIRNICYKFRGLFFMEYFRFSIRPIFLT